MKDFSVVIPGTSFELKSNETYRIEAREDTEAPMVSVIDSNGNTTDKQHLPYIVPNGDNFRNVNVPYNEQRRIWETGLFESSTVYSKVRDKVQVKKTVETLQENLLPELVLSFPEGALVPPGDDDTFDNYRYKIQPKKTYSTSSPIDFFGLWLAFLSNTVITPEQSEDKGSANRLKSVPFVIYSKLDQSKDKTTKEFEKSMAKTYFFNGITSEKEHEKEYVLDIANYIGIEASKKTDTAILNSSFVNWIDHKDVTNKNATAFNEAYKHFKTEEGLEEMDIYKRLSEGLKNKTVKRERGAVVLGTEKIETSSIKDAAKIINKTDELKEVLFGIAD